MRQKINRVIGLSPYRRDSLNDFLHPAGPARFLAQKGQAVCVCQYSNYKVNIEAVSYLAPRHQPSSLFLIFFAILTSRDKGMS